ncbi:MAG: ABC transporter permease [Bryobacterales bacterium]|nr:ABC transporter permease [Bryobacterales bacterium]
MRKNWKLARIAVFSLAIALAIGIAGIGISNYILLRPPAAADPGRLVTIYNRSPESVAERSSYPAYKFLRDQTWTFSDIAAFSTYLSKEWMEDRGEVLVELVTDNYFSAMGMRPLLGRLFARGDDDKKLNAAVLTYACWQRGGADPNIVGTTLRLNNGLTIIGVAPKEFTGIFLGLSADLIVLPSSASMDPERLARRDYREFTLMGRLKPGVSKKQAAAEIRTLEQNLAAEYPQTEKNRVPVLTRAMTLPPDAIKDAEIISAVLIALVLLVVIVACANAGSLLLALAVKRRQETLIKTAVGATRGRVIREFLGESLLLCAVGGGGGFVIAQLVLEKLSDFSTLLPLFGTIRIAGKLQPDPTVIAFSALLVIVASVATGLPSALYASSVNLSAGLSGEIAIGGRRKGVIRNTLVAVQVAICTLVLAGFGLCLRSVEKLRHVDPGFSARNVIGALVFDIEHDKHPGEQEQQIFRSLRAAVSQISGVESASLVDGIPFFGGFNRKPVESPGASKTLGVPSAVVDENYFATLGIPVFSGRVFNSADRKGAPDAVIVNRKLAETLWPNQDPIGKTIRAGKPPEQGIVVGVVADGKYNDLDEAPQPFMYYALSQHDQMQIQIIARTKGDPRLWQEPLIRAERTVGMQVPVPPFTMGDLLYINMLVPLLTLWVVGALSLLGVLLAITGLFGAVAYSVGERKRELGIRAALGALPADLLTMVVRELAATAGAGIGAGILIAAAATVLVRSQLFGIQPVEWVVLIPVLLGMAALTALVSCLAARPWIYGDPLEAVRHT